MLYLMSSYLYLALISALQFSCLSPFHLCSYCWVHMKASIFNSQDVPLIPTAKEQTGALTCIAWLIRKQGCMVRKQGCMADRNTQPVVQLPFLKERVSHYLHRASPSSQQHPVLLPHCCPLALPWGKKTWGRRGPGNAETWLRQQAASTLYRQDTDLGHLQAPLSNLQEVLEGYGEK